MTYRYWLHPLAVEDYKEAFAWYEDKQKGLGDRFLIAVKSKLEDIALYPENYGSKGRIKFREVKIDFFPYVVVYKIYKRKRQVFISSIHNTKKNPRKKYRK